MILDEPSTILPHRIVSFDLSSDVSQLRSNFNDILMETGKVTPLARTGSPLVRRLCCGGHHTVLPSIAALLARQWIDSRKSAANADLLRSIQKNLRCRQTPCPLLQIPIPLRLQALKWNATYRGGPTELGHQLNSRETKEPKRPVNS